MSEHVEFQQHRAHAERAAEYRRAVADWRETGARLADKHGGFWTAGRARALLQSLIDLFHAYNRVLWQHFPYCKQCLGGCCVVDAADLKGIDYVALALLEEPLPQRPPRSPVSQTACIYLTPRGCSWPTAWRPIKCATFYCLGSGEWRLDAADARYGAITGALRRVVHQHLPPLRKHLALDEQSLLDLLRDPVAFADALAERLDQTLVAALHTHYPALIPEVAHRPEPATGPPEATLAFIAEAVDHVYAAPPPPPDGLPLTAEQLLEDLETLQWVVLGQPAQTTALLREMADRYAGVPPPAAGEAPSLWCRMRDHLEQLSRQEETPLIGG